MACNRYWYIKCILPRQILVRIIHGFGSKKFEKGFLVLLHNSYHIGKKLQARQFLQNRLSEKAPGSIFFFYFSKTDLVIDPTFSFEFLG